MHRTQHGIILAAGIAALVSLGCMRDEVDEQTADTLAVGGDVDLTRGATVRVGDIMGNPTRYIGDTVTVEADVEEVLGTQAFLLDEDDALAGGIDNDLMVFSPRSAQLESIDDQWLNNRVRVIGTVRQVAVVELERELEWDLTPEIETKFKADKPVLIAHRFERIR